MDDRVEEVARQALETLKAVQTDIEGQLEPKEEPVPEEGFSPLGLLIFMLMATVVLRSAGHTFWTVVLIGLWISLIALAVYGLWRFAKWLAGVGVEQAPEGPADFWQESQ